MVLRSCQPDGRTGAVSESPQKSMRRQPQVPAEAIWLCFGVEKGTPRMRGEALTQSISVGGYPLNPIEWDGRPTDSGRSHCDHCQRRIRMGLSITEALE
jgi:hypothetical protein